jgi:hypothetical protein
VALACLTTSTSFPSTTEREREPTEQEKTFISYSSNWVLISKIYKVLKNLNTKRAKNSANKWTNDLNRHFSSEVQMTNRCAKSIQHL